MKGDLPQRQQLQLRLRKIRLRIYWNGFLLQYTINSNYFNSFPVFGTWYAKAILFRSIIRYNGKVSSETSVGMFSFFAFPLTRIGCVRMLIWVESFSVSQDSLESASRYHFLYR